VHYIYAYIFSYLAPAFWNKLHLDIGLSTTIDTFKCHLKTHFFTQFNNALPMLPI